MKPVLLAAAMLAMGHAVPVIAQESTAPKATSRSNAPAATAIEIGRTVPPAMHEQLSLGELGVTTNAIVISASTNRVDVIETPRTRIEGGVVPLIKKPSLITFVQLLNPFAPAEYGGTRVTHGSQGMGRVFADPIKTGPSSALLSVSDKPDASDTTFKERAAREK